MLEPLLTYWLAAQFLGLIGLPLTVHIFGALPDRGYAFAKPLGLLLTGYLAWMLAMLGLAGFGLGLIIMGAIMVGGSGLLLVRRNWPRFQWRRILAYELIFILALGFVALLRAHNPDPWGTERPMDFAFFNAIRRSEAFPPHDPWLAGYSINYYYFGYLLMAAVSLLTGVQPAVGYNMSLALTFGLTAVSITGIVLNLIDVVERASAAPSARQFSPAAMLWRSLAGGAALILVLLAGNQGGLLQVLSGSEKILALEGPDMARVLANGLGAREPIDLQTPFRGWDFDGTTTIIPTDRSADFNWWNPSRALWDTYIGGERRYAITEFPFFSFWLGDMHPHVMALPFGLLAMALALQTALRSTALGSARGAAGWIELIISAIILGSLYVINSWDVPTYVLLFLGALAIYAMRIVGARGEPSQRDGSTHPHDPALAPHDLVPAPHDPASHDPALAPHDLVPAPHDPASHDPASAPDMPHNDEPRRRVWWDTAAVAAIILVLAAVLFAPFHLTFRSLVGGKEPLIDLPLLGTITRTIGGVTWDRTAWYAFVIIFGLLLVLPMTHLLLRLGGDSADRWLWTARMAGWTTLATLLVGLIIGFPLLALLPLGVCAVALALAHAERPADAFMLLVFGLGCLVCFGTEVIYIRDVFESRMNTIFKFYYQVWLLWGTISGFALWALLRAAAPGIPRLLALVARVSALLLFAALLGGALVYPWLTAGRILAEPRPELTLQGRTPRDADPDEAAAVAWLRSAVPGSTVILEAVGDSYDPTGEGLAGVSAGSGLATVLGWPGHQSQWRGGSPDVLAQLGPRQNDVDTIYRTLDLAEARRLLDTYNVGYVFIGRAERNRYPPESLIKFAQLGTPAFERGSVVIYKVR